MKFFSLLILILVQSVCWAASLLIPMDAAQKDHLKAYGIAYFSLQKEIAVDWLLNYRGGSFLIEYSQLIANECKVRGVTFEQVNVHKANTILNLISSPAVNMNLVRMEKAPRIAVYSPKNDLILDESDAVILVLDYAEIPYKIIYDEEVLNDALVQYDWLHLHHEDFTGQISKGQYRYSAVLEAKIQEATAARLGYKKVSAMKFDVVKKILGFCAGGGYLFAMCSGAETFDIALTANGLDLESSSYDGGDLPLDYSRSLAFENFVLEPIESRSFSDINIGGWGFNDSGTEFFTLFDFSAKWDIIPSILTQNHEHIIREFSGLTTAFNKVRVKPEALIMAENKSRPYVRYIYGEIGKGHWTYYSGHDPEGSRGRGRGPTDLNLFPHSPGYRLILNNVLFPSAGKKKRKT